MLWFVCCAVMLTIPTFCKTGWIDKIYFTMPCHREWDNRGWEREPSSHSTV